MTYDALNRVTLTNEPFGVTLTATYDAVGNRTRVEDSFGGVRTATYDAANRNTKVEFGGASQTALRLDLAYDSRNEVSTITRFSDLAGNTKVGSSLYTYDGAGRLTNLRHRDSSDANIANYTHTYDLASRVLTEKLNGGSTVTYTYDDTNQLTNDGTNAYTYDLNGNRTMSGYTTGTGNQLTNDGTWTYTYDNEGNLTKKSKGASAETWTYGYDNLNHMTWAKDRSTDGGGTLLVLATYTYDILKNRIQTDVFTSSSGVVATTHFAYLDKDAFADMNSSNVLQMRRLYLDGIDQLFARITSGGTASWYLPDRLGSVRGLVDASGVAQDTITYDGFGQVSNETSASSGDRYKFTSREVDGETGLQYNRARYFDPAVGRWTSEDPIRFTAGDGNLYRYAFNSTTTFVDPSGLDSKFPGWFEKLLKIAMEAPGGGGAPQVPLHVWKYYYDRKAFDKYNRNGDNFITADEMRHYLRNNKDHTEPKPSESYKQRMREEEEARQRQKDLENPRPLPRERPSYARPPLPQFEQSRSEHNAKEYMETRKQSIEELQKIQALLYAAEMLHMAHDMEEVGAHIYEALWHWWYGQGH